MKKAIVNADGGGKVNMSKTILVISNNPDRCDECRLCKEVYGYVYVCAGANRQISDIRKIKKAKWCPLKKLPEKEEITYENDEYDDGYVFGWNQCLEKILSE